MQWRTLNYRLRLVSISDAPTQHATGAPTPISGDTNGAHNTAGDSENMTPPAFSQAVESMHAAQLRSEITLGTIRPPQKLAPFSHAVGLEVGDHSADDIIPVETDGEDRKSTRLNSS